MKTNLDFCSTVGLFFSIIILNVSSTNYNQLISN